MRAAAKLRASGNFTTFQQLWAHGRKGILRQVRGGCPLLSGARSLWRPVTTLVITALHRHSHHAGLTLLSELLSPCRHVSVWATSEFLHVSSCCQCPLAAPFLSMLLGLTSRGKHQDDT